MSTARPLTPVEVLGLEEMPDAGDGFGISLLLFGTFLLVTGYPIFKSGHFPKAIGVLYLVPGMSYLISAFGADSGFRINQLAFPLFSSLPQGETADLALVGVEGPTLSVYTGRLFKSLGIEDAFIPFDRADGGKLTCDGWGGPIRS